MRILVACEYSNTVAGAFRARGHDVMSCDILESEGESKYHHQGDAREVIGDGWDMIIAHPPCTYLSNAGTCWFRKGENTERMELMRKGVAFFKMFQDADVKHLCIENPVMNPYAGAYIEKPTQYVQPYHFGHLESKRTGLWLRGLPKLLPTNDVKAEAMALPEKVRRRLDHLPPSPDRAKLRSKTYQGIAEAMAEQWGSL